LWIDSGPFKACYQNIEDLNLGRLVASALDESKQGIPHPNSWGDLTKEVQKAAAVKSYKTFLNGTQMCLVEFYKTIKFIPHRNGGRSGEKKGFHPLDEYELEVPSLEEYLQLDVSLREAFAHLKGASDNKS
jgi:hypothetical protein